MMEKNEQSTIKNVLFPFFVLHTQRLGFPAHETFKMIEAKLVINKFNSKK